MRQKLSQWLLSLTVCIMLAAYCTTAQAALLDVGPTVLQVNPSTVPNLGHGYPLWYRDTNRLPLELCLNEAMCFFANPNPPAAVSFPGNIPDELFYFAAVASIPLPGVNQKAILDQAIEAAYSTGGVVPGAQITFARIRIRIDTPVAGQYIVTTPYKQFTFNVTDVAAGINFTEDIGIAEGGVFTGALAGTVGPFLYCTDAPFPATDGTGGSYIGKNATLCPVLGSTFIPPGQTLPANYFRVQGPVGFGTVQTDQFSVQGKIHTTATPTPLTVDRATYTRDNTNTQVEVFATTQPIANATISPINFALAGTHSALEFTHAAATVPTTMETNNAIDGKFFAASAPFANPATMPATVRVTNTADVPPTVVDVPLVDEVVISSASYTPAANTLKVSAASGDKLAASLPTLTVTMKDGAQNVLLGTIANGGGSLSVTFPFIVGPKTYNIPPESVTVTSSKGGSDTELVTSPLNRPPVAVNDTAIVAPGGLVVIPVSANDSDPDIGDSIVPASVTIVTPPAVGINAKGTALNNFNGTITYTALPGSSGTDTFTYTISDTFGAASNVATVTVTIISPPVAAAIAVPTPEDTLASINVAAAATATPPALVDLASVIVTVQPTHGTAVVVGDGTIRYTPALNYNGPDSFSYTLKDTLGAVSVAKAVTITVTAVADAPLTLNDSATTLQNAPVTINVLANDSHPDGLPSSINSATLAIVANAPITAGTASVVAGQVVFTPAAAFTGSTSFTYTVSDNTAPTPRVSAPATVAVTVTPVNAPPVAVNDVATTFVNTPRTINVIANDTDANGTINPATLIIGALPPNVTVVPSTTGTATFTATVAGTYTFTYTVKDNLGAISNPATVTVSVASVTVITDSVSINKGQFTASTRQWNVEGTTTNATAGTLVTIRVGSGLTGQIIGTTPVATDGRWKFQLGGNPGNVGPDANNTISVTLPSGASRLAFPIAVR